MLLSHQTLVPGSLEAKKTTFFWDLWRSVSSGIRETATETFLLLIAIRHFGAGETGKALLVASMPLGLILSPLVLNVLVRVGGRYSTAAATIMFFSAAILSLTCALNSFSGYLICCMLSILAANTIVPMTTQLYQDNYPAHERGKLFTRAVMLRMVVTATFAQAAGTFLDGNVHQRYLWVLIIVSAAFAFNGFCLWHYPSRRAKKENRQHPFHSLGFIKRDKLFCIALTSWMISGFGLLTLLPLRVDYLVNARYNLVFSEQEVAFVLMVVPSAMKLICSPIWGKLFDRANVFCLWFFVLLHFAAGLLVFFHSTSLPGLALGMAIYGIGMGGGELSWSLWVTRLAAPEHVADYMAVHTLLTGLRGVLTPFIGFYAALYIPLHQLSYLGASLIVIGGSLIFYKGYLQNPRQYAGTYATEEAVE